MANVHRLNEEDQNNDNNERDYFNPLNVVQPQVQNNNNRNYSVGVNAMRSYLYKNNGANPRNENFFNFIKNTMCPLFSLCSFTFIVIVVNIVLFLVTLCFGIENTNSKFLCPKRKTLENFGSLGYYLIIKSPSQIYRFITNIFLHLSFTHIFANVLTLFIFATLIEQIFQFWRFMIIYLASGILGGLIYITMSKDSRYQSVGASISLFGIFGAYFAYWIINYETLNRLLSATERCCMINVLLFMMLFLLLFQIIQNFSGNDNINIIGHFIGMMFGFFLAFIINPPDFEDTTACMKYLYWKLLAICVIVDSFIGGVIFLILNYTSKN